MCTVMFRLAHYLVVSALQVILVPLASYKMCYRSVVKLLYRHVEREWSKGLLGFLVGLQGFV